MVFTTSLTKRGDFTNKNSFYNSTNFTTNIPNVDIPYTEPATLITHEFAGENGFYAIHGQECGGPGRSAKEDEEEEAEAAAFGGVRARVCLSEAVSTERRRRDS